MKRRSSATARAALIGVLVLPAFARGDVAPDDDDRCTVQRETRRYRACVACAGRPHDPENKCEREVGPDFTFACRTRPSPRWTEVWCKDTMVDDISAGEATLLLPDAGLPAKPAAALPVPKPIVPPRASGGAAKGDNSWGCALGVAHDQRGSVIMLALAASIGFLITRRTKRQ